MSRTTMTFLAGLMVVGCVVALLPAQESSRRTASKYKTPPNTLPPATERPSLAPPPEINLPPVVSATSRSTPGSRSEFQPAGTPADFGGQFGTDAAAGEATNISAGPGFQSNQSVSPPAELGAGEATTADLDGGQLHSVLKRSNSAVSQPVAAPPPTSFMPPPTSAPAAEVSRHVPSLPPTPVRSSTATPGSQSRSIRDLVVGGKSAALKVEVAGPQGVTVGKPAAYIVSLSNEGDTTAEDVQVRITLPAWVSVQSVQPTNGDAGVAGDSQNSGRLVWNVPRVAARAHETLKLQLVTREGDAFDLGVEWTTRPTTTRAAIIVKQPQIALSLAGPADMVFGEEKSFTLTISNPGTGDAERVVISVAAGTSPPQQFDAGNIPSGHKKEVPLAVVASQAGAIELQISAGAESGLEARTIGRINVRKAEVNVAINGPPLKYAGSESVYALSVTNSGSAAADNVNLALALPPGAKYLGGIDGASVTGSMLKWKIASLAPAGERLYEVRLQLGSPGKNRIAVQSQAAASGVATCAAETEVEAVADLKLVVNDPAGPMPTGEQATYELQVVNRGSQAAKQVKIVMQFSDGVEPISFEGCEARIVPGQVLCHPLPQLGPGEQATLRVKAKAQQPGSHHFRIEVTSTDGDVRLVSEGTTRFFTETGRSSPAASTARKPNLLPGTTTTLR